MVYKNKFTFSLLMMALIMTKLRCRSGPLYRILASINHQIHESGLQGTVDQTECYKEFGLQ